MSVGRRIVLCALAVYALDAIGYWSQSPLEVELFLALVAVSATAMYIFDGLYWIIQEARSIRRGQRHD